MSFQHCGRCIRRREANVFLLAQALSTSIGYLIFSFFFSATHWSIIVFWMYVVAFGYFAIKYPYIWFAKTIFLFVPSTVIFLTLSTLVYWYAFWIGLTLHPGQAGVALAFLSLMMIATPLGLGTFTRDSVPREKRFWVSSVVVVISVFCMKLGGSVFDIFGQHFWTEAKSKIHIDSLSLFLLVVASQAVTAILRSKYMENRAGIGVPDILAGLKVDGKLAFNAPLSLSYAASFVISAFVVVCLSTSGSGGELHEKVYQNWGIVFMGFFGFLFPILVNNHLVLNRGMPQHFVEPWLAVRPLLYLILSLFWLSIFCQSVTQGQEGEEFLSLFGLSAQVDTNLIDDTGSMFWIGATLGIVAFVILMNGAWRDVNGFCSKVKKFCQFKTM